MSSGNDRELLELAAKAIGHTLYWTGNVGYGNPFIYFGPDISEWTPYSGHDKFELGATKFWNPLIDDGDALRLAVQLGMEVEVCHTQKVTRIVYWSTKTGTIQITEWFKDHDLCPYAATRKVIVRVAAEVGKA